MYLNHYNTFLDKYMRSYVPKAKEALNLTADAEAPQDELNVQVRVLQDGLGEIQTADSGVVKLKKGYQLFLKRSDVEQLIRAGKVVQWLPRAATASEETEICALSDG